MGHDANALGRNFKSSAVRKRNPRVSFLSLCFTTLIVGIVYRSRSHSLATRSGIRRLGSTCGVITTILEVNEAVVYFVANHNASLIVVGDLKTNHTEWDAFQRERSESVVYLSPTTQRQLPFKVLRYIPWNHFGRKSVGFLYAIAAGCERIFDFDDDNHLQRPDGFVRVSTWTRYELNSKANDVHVFNPYPFFQPTNDTFVWPRGFPLQFIRDERTYNVDSPSWTLNHAKDEDFETLAVIQSLADHDPDVDAIYRMTSPLPIRFRREKSILLPPRGVYTPWNAQAVLLSKPAFFGLLLPVTVTGRVSDIWRSYITTRLLWETRYKMGFSSAFVTQYRNPHSYMVDFVDEDDLYNKVDDLLEALASWTSHGLDHLEDAYVQLIEKLVFQTKILGEVDLLLAKAWVKDLQAVGYTWPRIHTRLPTMTLSSAAVVDQRHLGGAPSEIPLPGTTTENSEVQRGDTSDQKHSVGAFVVTRNDGYGGNLLARASISLARMLDVVDELIVIDLNTRNANPLVTLLPESIVKSNKLKSFVISPEACARELGSPCEDKLYEALGRNVGLRESTADFVISTNPEIIFPSRYTVDKIIELALKDTKRDAVILPRRDVSYDEGVSIARSFNEENTKSTLRRHVNDWNVGSVGLMDVSIITNCGDFQMAHRHLWQLAGGFALKHGHNFGDSNMIARWLSAGATVHLMNTTVFHVQHKGRQQDPASWNEAPSFRVVEVNGVKRLKSSWDEA